MYDEWPLLFSVTFYSHHRWLVFCYLLANSGLCFISVLQMQAY